ncbi:Transcription and mRNA export factor ENY2 [Echinococcus granulosus]|uniref:Transcription and mRNA export factor ENY2 n=2 Tax=Echinococcus granulosus TaxID=6210 RepID=W6U946_ECHGR|nr:Enhancer of yellow 2 transcription factor [Echinococcus granulosus]EUB57923.1 Enhancer of yellow 2 transcription factor [Echinococcus granulosus]KAH9280576.1 Transcription and mRNA export factor ENY2 [Echinococcus granulosus]
MTAMQEDCAKLRTYINEQLMLTGERERLKDLLRTRLLECGWRDELKSYCKEVIAKKGISCVTVNDLVTELTPVARRLVPDSVKQELVDAIRKFLPKDREDNDDKYE